MLTIQRTEDGRLALANRRQSDVADDEAQARRMLQEWGHTEVTINRAFAEMGRAAGEVVSPAWTAHRPMRKKETPMPKPEPAASRRDRRGKKAQDERRGDQEREATGGTEGSRSEGAAAAARAADRVTAASGPPAASGTAAGADRTPGSGRAPRSGGASKTAGAAPQRGAVESDGPRAEEDAPASGSGAGRRRTRASRARTGAEVTAAPVRAPAAEAVENVAAEPDTGVKTPRRTRKKPVAAVNDDPGAGERTDAPSGPRAGAAPTKASRARSAAAPGAPSRAKSVRPATAAATGDASADAPVGAEAPGGAGDAGSQPVPTAEGATPPVRKRVRSRKGAPVAARETSAAETDPVEAALALFTEGTRALRGLEGAALPFARGPWTELRLQAEHIVRCLGGKEPRSR